MKCVILSCGCKNNLKPLVCNQPAALSLFGRPIAGHMIALAARAGARSVCIDSPDDQCLLDCGEACGAQPELFTQGSGMGNAECAHICADAGNDEAVLIADCDVVCDFDLKAALELHRKNSADATILLHPGHDGLEEAEAVVDSDGRVTRIIDRPVWGQRLPGLSLTGLYIFQGRALREASRDRHCDFIRDLIPRLLREGKNVRGCVMDGFWRRIRDISSYMECVRAALESETRLDMGIPQRSPGVWAEERLPEDAVIVPPCYIGGDVSIGRGSVIGPYTVLERGSAAGEESRISESVCHCAMIGDSARISGAVIGRGAVIRQGARLEKGCVIGEGAVVAENAQVPEGVQVWAYQELHDGADRPRPLSIRRLVFSEDGSIGGSANVDITPEICVLLGMAVGGRRRVGLSCDGGRASMVMAGAVESGLCASGARTLRHDGGYLSAAAYAPVLYGLQSEVFVCQIGDKVRIYVFDDQGLPISRSVQRKIERELVSGGPIREDPRRAGGCYPGSGTLWAYAAAAAREAKLAGKPVAVRVAVSEGPPPNQALSSALSMLGIITADRGEDVPFLSVTEDGTGLVLRDESGQPVWSKAQQVLLSLSEFEYGSGTVVVPEDAPIIIEELADRLGGQVIRFHEIGDRQKAPAFMFRDGIFAGARICAWLAVSGRGLRDQLRRIPDFSTSAKEIPINARSSIIMERLSQHLGQEVSPSGSLRVREEQGWVRVRPSIQKSSLKILTEADNAELAAELCNMIVRKTKELDSKVSTD